MQQYLGTWEREGRRPNVRWVVRISGRGGAKPGKRIEVLVKDKQRNIYPVQCIVRRNGYHADPVEEGGAK